jgi:hypothetical protein
MAPIGLAIVNEYLEKGVLKSEGNISMHEWGDYIFVMDTTMTAESCKEFMFRVLYHRHIGNNTHLPLGGEGVEGCFHNDQEAAEMWWNFVTGKDN